MANAGAVFRTDAGEAFLNGVAPSLAANLFAAALVTTTDSEGAGTEVVLNGGAGGINYARRQITGSPRFTEQATAGVFQLTDEQAFNIAAGGDWGTITSIVFTTILTGALAAANVVAFVNLAATKIIDDTDTLRLGNGSDFVITLT